MNRYLINILLFFAATAYGQQNRMDFLLDKLNDGGKSDYVMIIAHRGDWRNAPENSLQAYQSCIDAGFDGIEIDVQMTKDSVIVMMHDKTIDRTTTGKGKVSDYTLAELKELYLRSPIGVVTRQKIPTLDEVLEMAKGKILIQVDKWQPVKEKVIEVAKQHGCMNQIILRGTKNSKQVIEEYGKFPEGLIYIPVLVCKGDGDNEKLDDFYNAHHKAILRMIRMVVENAHKCGKWAGICGELGADLELTDAFMEMGVAELSVAPSMVLKVRKNIREYTAN